jgi:hypothetical protein
MNAPAPPPPVDIGRDPTYPDHVRWQPFPSPDPEPEPDPPWEPPCWPGCPVCADEPTEDDA